MLHMGCVVKRRNLFRNGVLSILLAMLQVICLFSLTVKAEENTAEQGVENPVLQLYAQSAVLLDGESGRILYGKEETTERPMASTTKIMTCILALERGNLNDIVTISKKAASQPEVHLGMQEGETFYLEDLLYSIMLESHNDSAWAIAEHIGNGSVETFAMMMNKKAEEIGCEHTYFITPNGLDGKDEGGIHHTTAADLAHMMQYCIEKSPKKEEFLEITQTRSRTITDTTGKKTVVCRNHNAFLDMMDGALTGKTGFTADAGYCYVGAVKRDNRTFIVALLACGWPNNKNYKWKDMKTLVQYGIDHYFYRTYWEEAEDNPEIRLLEAGKTIEIKNSGQEKRDLYENGQTTVFLNITEEDKDKRILMREDEKISIKTDMKTSVTAPVKKGTEIGNVQICLENQKLDEKSIKIGKNIPEKTFLWVYKNIWKEFFPVKEK